jgi:signal peptidase I
LLWAALAFVLVRSAVADVNRVSGGSMRPGLLPGDRILVNNLAYGFRLPGTGFLVRWAEPRRGDVAVLASPADGQLLIKRVVGLAGDRLEMRGHRLFVNGLAADDDSPPSGPGVWQERLGGRAHPVLTVVGEGPLLAFGPVEVPPGEYFVLGDDRDRSADSRRFGCVPAGRIVGRVSAVVLSLDAGRNHLPRWDRFLCRVP